MGVSERVGMIAERLREGATLADVKREIIDTAPLDEAGCAALWRYAATRPESLRRARAFGDPREAKVG